MTAKPKRRWFQFSLKTFLLVMLLFAFGFAWLSHQAREQRKAVAWVKEMGGTVGYDYEAGDGDGDPFGTKVVHPPGPKWLRDILGIDFFDEVVVVALTSTPVSDLTPLAGLTSLRALNLDSTQVSDLMPLAGSAGAVARIWRFDCLHVPVL